MNTNWIELPNTHPDYIDGCWKFIELAKENLIEGNTLCPCKKCKVGKWFSLDVVHGHILFKGFYRKYKKWIFHGQESTHMSSAGGSVESTNGEKCHVCNTSRWRTSGHGGEGTSVKAIVSTMKKISDDLVKINDDLAKRNDDLVKRNEELTQVVSAISAQMAQVLEAARRRTPSNGPINAAQSALCTVDLQVSDCSSGTHQGSGLGNPSANSLDELAGL